MHVVAVAWIFVVVLMALAEGTSTQGSWLGAFFTLLLYGLLPLSIVLYVMGTPMRRRARLQAEAADADPTSPDPDGGGQPAGDPLTPEREKP